VRADQIVFALVPFGEDLLDGDRLPVSALARIELARNVGCAAARPPAVGVASFVPPCVPPSARKVNLSGDRAPG